MNEKITIENLTLKELEKLQESGNYVSFVGVENLPDEDVNLVDEELSDEQQRYKFASTLKLKKIKYQDYQNAWNDVLKTNTKIAEYRITIGACQPVHIMSNGYKSENVKKLAQDTLENYLNQNGELHYLPWYSLYFIVVTRRVDKNAPSQTIFKKIAFYSEDKDIIYNFNDERCVYIGQTKSDRFKNGHKAFTILNDPKYEGYEKRVYMASLSIRFEDSSIFIPLEFIPNNSYVKDIRDYFESALIFNMATTHDINRNWRTNYKKDKFKHVQNAGILHPTKNIQVLWNLPKNYLIEEYSETRVFDRDFPNFITYKTKLGY